MGLPTHLPANGGLMPESNALFQIQPGSLINAARQYGLTYEKAGSIITLRRRKW